MSATVGRWVVLSVLAGGAALGARSLVSARAQRAVVDDVATIAPAANEQVPQAAVGPTGPQGKVAQGAVGPTGPQGKVAQGAVGPTGPQGS